MARRKIESIHRALSDRQRRHSVDTNCLCDEEKEWVRKGRRKKREEMIRREEVDR